MHSKSFSISSGATNIAIKSPIIGTLIALYFYASGDEGSPLVCQRCDTCDWYVAGIGAFSAECAVAGAYNTYIEINAASEAWILGIISNGAASYIPEQCVRPCKYP